VPPPERDALDVRVRAAAARVVGRDLPPDAALDLDSLEAAELALALEEELGIHVPDRWAPRSLADAVAGARSSLAEGGRTPPDGSGHLQWLAEAVLGPVLRGYYGLEVAGDDRVPQAGPVVLASNHDSLLDIPILVVACPRRVWFMAKRELFGGRFASWFFHVLGGFPVDRAGPDVGAIRAAIRVLEEGGVLGMYPEGTRSRDFLPFRPGAAWASLRVGAPLVPVAIDGTAEAMPRGSPLPRRTTVRVTFGEPLDIEREHDPRARVVRAREITRAVRDAVERLRATGPAPQ
jgi:1-acyl-sn-glycerol-3-phosphate acyltransferase